MREIITMGIGRFGINLSSQYNRQMAKEHQIDLSTGKYQGKDIINENLNCYFREVSEGVYKPRSMMIDAEASVIDSVLASDLGKFYDQDMVIHDNANHKLNAVEGMYDLESEIGLLCLD